MISKKLYLKDTYQFYFEGVIEKTGKDEKGMFIILDQTAFYPQGGGQPADHGTLKNDLFETRVIHVAEHGDEIRHYIDAATLEIAESQKVFGILDKDRRLLNARYHTAAHLLSNIVETIYPQLKAMKGHSFPGEAYVEFAGDEAVNAEVLKNKMHEAITKNDPTKVFEISPMAFEEQFYTLPYKVPAHKKFRVMQIGDMPPVPCGGTHVSSVGEIGLFTIIKIKSKKGTLRISYGVI